MYEETWGFAFSIPIVNVFKTDLFKPLYLTVRFNREQKIHYNALACDKMLKLYLHKIHIKPITP